MVHVKEQTLDLVLTVFEVVGTQRFEQSKQTDTSIQQAALRQSKKRLELNIVRYLIRLLVNVYHGFTTRCLTNHTLTLT